ncbi:MAG: toprim domain-containing protein [Myxococcaceae bacterium]|nr:toprim domain-containing protein [Myxococcaceae bacterium]
MERLKKEVSLERLVTARGVELQKRGADLVGRCPFHEDKTPSLVVTPAKNLWHCMGACRTGGSVVDWVMRAEGVNFRHAVELLRGGVDLSGPVGPRHATVPKLPSPVSADVDDAQLLAQVRDFYCTTMRTAGEAWSYLESRGLKHDELVTHFRVGFSNRTLGLRLPQTNREAGALLRGRLQKLGVMRESGHEHFAGSLTVPLHDEAGQVVGMYGRKVTKGLRPGTPLHMYLPGPHRAAFNSAALAGQKSAVVCEALLDAMSFWCAGFRNVTAAYGVEGFTAHHLEALKRHGVKDVLIAYDRDDAGDAGAEALAKQLLPQGFSCWRVLFPRGMDANEYAVKISPAAKSLNVALRQAAWMGQGAAPGTPSYSAVSTDAVPAAASPLAAKPRWQWTAEEKEREANEVRERGLRQLSPLPRAATPVTGSAPTNSTSVAISTAAAASSSPTPRAGWVAGTATPRAAPQAPPATSPTPAASSSAPSPSSTAASASSPSTSSAVPKAPELQLEEKADELVFHFGPRRYRVRGLPKALSAEVMKLNLLVSAGELFHVDTLDMYSARARAAFVRQAFDELRVPEEALKRDMGALLLKLEELQEKQLKEKLAPKAAAPTLTEAETAAALELLKSPALLERVVADFARCGVVGEESNKLLGYLAAVSRKLEEPLAVLIQSSSAAGKSSLMEAVLAFVPDEDKVKYSAMTGQSLFYMGDANLKHKVLAVVEEEGAARASYALKLLQSEGELTIASTGKDPASGKLVTHEYHVEGPTQLFLTTTAAQVDEELLNRCLVLTVDEERAQTKAIHEKQKEKQTLEGLLARREKTALLKLHQNAQRLLRPLLVANPFARQLTFLDDRTRARRDFPKYLTLIRTIALLHQHQRPVKTVEHHGEVVEYIEATLDDVAVANRLAAAALGRSLDDLPPQTRRLLELLDGFVTERCAADGVRRPELRFSRREVREASRWGDTQLKVHLGRLVELEYLALHRGAGGGFLYELRYERAATGERFLVGLADVEALRHEYDSNPVGPESPRSGPGRPPVGPQSAPVGVPANGNGEHLEAGSSHFSPSAAEKALRNGTGKITSYEQRA